MIQKIFAGLLAVVLVLTMPLSALAEDTADTTATEETVAAKEEGTPDREEEDTSTEPSDSAPTTQPTESTAPKVAIAIRHQQMLLYILYADLYSPNNLQI